MEQVEQLLREEFGRPDGVLALERAPLLARARAVRRRRAVASTIAGTAAVALVAAGWGIQARGDRPGNRPAVIPRPEVVSPGRVLDIGFADPAHGYALGHVCTADVITYGPSDAGPASSPCSPRLRATTDGGRTWHDRALPEPVTRSRQPGELIVLTADRVVYQSVDGRWFTTDGARSWRQTEGGMTPRQVETITPGALLANGMLQDRRDLYQNGPEVQRSQVRMVNPDGSTGWVPGPAEGRVIWTQPNAVGDGEYWVACATADGRPCAAVTTDRGRTWRQVAPPETLTADQGARSWYGSVQVTTANGRFVCLQAMYRPQQPVVKRSGGGIPLMSRVYCSVDAGATWRELPLAQYSVGAVVARADGSVLVTASEAQDATDRGAVYRLSPGDQRLTVVSGAPRGLSSLAVSGGRLIAIEPRSGQDAQERFYTSLDGRKWSPIAPL